MICERSVPFIYDGAMRCGAWGIVEVRRRQAV